MAGNGWRRRCAGWVLGLSMWGAAAGRVAWAHFDPVTCKNNAFSEQQEITEGGKVAAEVYKQMPVLPESDPVSRYVQQLGAKLVRFAPLTPGLNEPWPFNFHVVASDEINAFALPGGSIFVNLGTVQAAETEAQLAGVMAHEISHVVMRHSTCNMAQRQRRGILYGLGAIGSAILLGNGAAGQLAQAGIGMGQNLDFLHMSRGDEQQADLLGTDILYDAGYDPRGLPQFFETIRAKYGAGGAQFLSDHPNPGNRTEYVNQEIATLPRRERPVVTTDEFKRVHAQAMQEKALNAKEIQAGAWKRSGAYASGPGSGAARLTETGSGAQAANGPAPLPASALGMGGDGLTPMQGQGFGISYPARWRASTDGSGAVTLAPEGGAGDFGLAYGVLIAREGQQGRVRDRAALQSATTALLASLKKGNAGLTEAGSLLPVQVGGQAATTIDLRGVSPIAGDGGQPAVERERLVTVQRPDGDVSYLVFVAPEAQFGVLKPTFDAMLESFRVR